MWACGTDIKAVHVFIILKVWSHHIALRTKLHIFKIVTWVVGSCIVLHGDTSVLGDTGCIHSDPEDGGSMIF